MTRRVALPIAVLVLVATPVAATAAGVPFRAAQAMWREIVGDGRGEAQAPVDRIVVFNALPVAQLKITGPRARQHAIDAQRQALAKIATTGIPLHVKRSFVTALNAVEVEVGPGDVAELERSPVVRGVYAVRNVYPASVVSSALQVLGPAARPLALKGPDQGAGVRVALLDGPVDASHPYLSGRVLPGWNAVANRPSAARPAMAAAMTHGTAMAGIVVGENGPDGLHGVAPHAQLLPIQVLALQHGVLVGSTGSLLAGLDRALDPNADGNLLDHVPIVVAPVAEPFAAFAESPEAMAAVSAERVGTLLIAAAGNDGPTRARFGTVATPAAGRLWLAVGAVDGRPLLPQVGANATGGGLDSQLNALPLAGALAPIAGQALPLAAPSGPTRSDPTRPAGQAVSGDVVDDYLATDGTRLVDGKVALVPRDGTSLEAKAIAAAAAGARALVVYGDGAVPNAALGLDDRVAIPVLVVARADGQTLAQGAGTARLRDDHLRLGGGPGEPRQRHRHRLLEPRPGLPQPDQARDRGARRGHHHVAAGRRLHQRDRHLGRRSPGRRQRGGAARRPPRLVARDAARRAGRRGPVGQGLDARRRRGRAGRGPGRRRRRRRRRPTPWRSSPSPPPRCSAWRRPARPAPASRSPCTTPRRSRSRRRSASSATAAATAARPPGSAPTGRGWSSRPTAR